MNSILAEIERVKAAIAKTNSPKLQRDYMKHLQRLQIKLKEAQRRKGECT